MHKAWRVILLTLCYCLSACSAFAPGINAGPNRLRPDQDASNGISGVHTINIDNALLAKQESVETQFNSHDAYLLPLIKEQSGYLVGANDVLTITVWNHIDLTNPASGPLTATSQPGFTVDATGKIYYPYIGEIKVSGKTVSQIRQLLTQKLAAYIRDPSISVSVATYNSQHVIVTGEVSKPSDIPLTDTPNNLTEIINAAGGPSAMGDLRHVNLKRNGHDYIFNLLDLPQVAWSNAIALKHGDIVYVPNFSEYRVYLVGEVKTPKSLNITLAKLSLTDALMQAGGVNQLTSNPAQIYVLRRDKGETFAYRLNASDPEALVLGSKFILKNQDVVYVTTYKLTNWNRILSQILPSTNFATRAINDY